MNQQRTQQTHTVRHHADNDAGRCHFQTARPPAPYGDDALCRAYGKMSEDTDQSSHDNRLHAAQKEEWNERQYPSHEGR